MHDVTFVRIYLSEHEHMLKGLMAHLHDVEKVRGVTVFRAISGYGPSGRVHEASLLDLSLDLPLVVEFFDEPQKVERVLQHLGDTFEAAHVVSWPARVNR